MGNTASAKDRTAILVEATQTGDVTAVQQVLQEDLSLIITASTWQGRSVWHLAAKHGHVHMLQLLKEMVERGPGEDKRARRRWKKLTKRCPSPSLLISHLVNSRDVRKQTPLHMAAVKGHAECAKVLLDWGADPWAADYYGGRTPLHYAAGNGHVPVIAAILSHPRASITSDHPPSSHEHSHQDYSRPPPSLKRPPNTATTRLVDIRNANGYTPLHYAVWAGSCSAIRALASFDAFLCARSMSSNPDWVEGGLAYTPLHLAAVRKDMAAAKALLTAHMQASAIPDLPLQGSPAQGMDDEARRAAERRRRRMDPRRQGDMWRHVSGRRQLPLHLAILGGAPRGMVELLHPEVPLSFVLAPEDMAAAGRLYGPPRLAVLAAEALHAKLLADIRFASSQRQQPQATAETATAPATATSARPPAEPTAQVNASSSSRPCPPASAQGQSSGQSPLSASLTPTEFVPGQHAPGGDLQGPSTPPASMPTPLRSLPLEDDDLDAEPADPKAARSNGSKPQLPPSSTWAHFSPSRWGSARQRSHATATATADHHDGARSDGSSSSSRHSGGSDCSPLMLAHASSLDTSLALMLEGLQLPNRQRQLRLLLPAGSGLLQPLQPQPGPTVAPGRTSSSAHRTRSRRHHCEPSAADMGAATAAAAADYKAQRPLPTASSRGRQAGTQAAPMSAAAPVISPFLLLQQQQQASPGPAESARDAGATAAAAATAATSPRQRSAKRSLQGPGPLDAACDHAGLPSTSTGTACDASSSSPTPATAAAAVATAATATPWVRRAVEQLGRAPSTPIVLLRRLAMASPLQAWWPRPPPPAARLAVAPRPVPAAGTAPAIGDTFAMQPADAAMSPRHEQQQQQDSRGQPATAATAQLGHRPVDAAALEPVGDADLELVEEGLSKHDGKAGPQNQVRAENDKADGSFEGDQGSASEEGEGGDGEEEEEVCCGVCLEEASQLRGAMLLVRPCSHWLCSECASALVNMHTVRPATCPFCRGLVSGFGAGCLSPAGAAAGYAQRVAAC